MPAKFAIFPSHDNSQYYYRLESSNGELLLSGEGFNSRESCLRGIGRVKENAPYYSRYVRKNAAAQYGFQLKSASGEIIGQSGKYRTGAARENGIENVKESAPGAPVE